MMLPLASAERPTGPLAACLLTAAALAAVAWLRRKDGRKQAPTPPELGPLPAGTRVQARYHAAGKRLYPATVRGYDASTGTFELAYDDGEVWWSPGHELQDESGAWLVPAGLDRPRFLRHRVEANAVDAQTLQGVFARVQTIFEPDSVPYANTNPDITARDAESGGHGRLAKRPVTLWKASMYAEVDAKMGGGMQKHVSGSPALLEALAPLLEVCDRRFVAFFERMHGRGSVKELGRLQAFVTRYRPQRGESGLLRHIDGAQIDGSAILALPHAPCGYVGGALTVWERLQSSGAERLEATYEHVLQPGALILLDGCVWHQGNPITAGERWSLVVFYRTKPTRPGSRLIETIKMAAKDRLNR